MYEKKKMTKNSLFYVSLTAQLPFMGEMVEEGMHLHIYFPKVEAGVLPKSFLTIYVLCELFTS